MRVFLLCKPAIWEYKIVFANQKLFLVLWFDFNTYAVFWYPVSVFYVSLIVFIFVDIFFDFNWDFYGRDVIKNNPVHIFRGSQRIYLAFCFWIWYIFSKANSLWVTEWYLLWWGLWGLEILLGSCTLSYLCFLRL